MNKKLLICLIPVVIIIIVLVIIMIIKNVNSSKKLELTYEINAGIPFKWVFEIEDPSIVEFEKSYVIRDDNKGGLVGGSVYTNYVFKGKKEGKTKIIFKQVSITDEDYPPLVEENTVKVDKDLNISLVVLDK